MHAATRDITCTGTRVDVKYEWKDERHIDNSVRRLEVLVDVFRIERDNIRSEGYYLLFILIVTDIHSFAPKTLSPYLRFTPRRENTGILQSVRWRLFAGQNQA